MAGNDENKLTVSIKTRAKELGFSLCGIARSKSLGKNRDVLKEWCEKGMNDRMSYLSRNIEKRTDPAILYPGAKSIVVTGLSYYSDIKQKQPDVPVISRYVYGKDYHVVIADKLEQLLNYIRGIKPEAAGRIYVDTGPILEKQWAREAGLGWQGRHSVIINKDIGSFFFIGILILNIDLSYDRPLRKDYCGNCRLCIESCPTGAINDNRTIDARKCIANLTIEGRGPVPENIVPYIGKRVYGCDRCQEVCPWNKDIKPVKAPEFTISEEVAGMTLEEWQSLSRERFERLFGGSAMERVSYEKFIENIRIVTS